MSFQPAVFTRLATDFVYACSQNDESLKSDSNLIDHVAQEKLTPPPFVRVATDNLIAQLPNEKGEGHSSSIGKIAETALKLEKESP